MELKFGKRHLLIYWITILICGTIIFYGNFFELDYLTVKSDKQLLRKAFLENLSQHNFTLDTPGCKIPYLDAFDNKIRKFIEPRNKSTCNEGNPPLVASNLTSIFLLPTSFPAYKVEDLNYLRCCYRPFRRIAPKKNQQDKEIELSTTCHSFQTDADIQNEFIKVTCEYNSTSIYVDTFSFVPIKNVKVEADNETLNVLIIGLDAVSRLNLHRQMPKTVKYLKHLGGIELAAYNKVGDNTFPNLIPVLTGLTEEELKQNCWPDPNDNFDDCPFVWKRYNKKGYVTAYGEDASWMGLFNYQRKGFKQQSTDYNYGYFNRMSEELIGNSKKMNCYQCAGSRLVYKEFLDYMGKFVTTMDTNRLPYFSFFWEVTVSHDDLNLPQIADDDYHSFFQTLSESNQLDNTVLVFMSDHGIRWGDIRETFQGRMEERLPFVILLLPESFRTKYTNAYQNLEINTKRLTTPFDLHETLVALVDPEKLLVQTGSKIATRGISLFESVSEERSCKDAGISDHWCTCTRSMDVEINDKVRDAAKFTVDHINLKLKNYAQCANLTLDAVIDAKLVWNPSTNENASLDYALMLKTLPNEAVFEVTLSALDKKNSFEIIGSISRLNLYGNQSWCITDFHLKLYCYCV